MKTRLKNYLSITKKEWNGLVVLVVLIGIVLAVPYVYQLFHKDTVIDFKDFNKTATQLANTGAASGFDPEKEKPKPSETVVVQQPLSPLLVVPCYKSHQACRDILRSKQRLQVQSLLTG